MPDPLHDLIDMERYARLNRHGIEGLTTYMGCSPLGTVQAKDFRSTHGLFAGDCLTAISPNRQSQESKRRARQAAKNADKCGGQ